METKAIDVTCPCCESRLHIDVRTAKVLRTVAPEQLDELGKPVADDSSWDAALSRVSGRTDSSLDRFDAALEKEQNREADLDDLFRKASEKLDEEDEDEL